MRFRGFRRFIGKGHDPITKFLHGELYTSLKDLFSGLNNLTFDDNFQSFTASVKLKSGEEGRVGNQLKVAPSKMIVVRLKGHGVISEGSTGWNNAEVSVKNHGPDTVTATILFLR